MSRIKTLFDRKGGRILNVYCTAGFPELDSTMPVVKALEAAGVDMVEIGIPYSDPLADGPVIQASSSRALKNGMTIHKLFEQLEDLRKETNIPVVLMGYMNPVLQFGFEKFCRLAAGAGIDGLILPDLPVHEYEKEYGQLIKKYGLDFIFLVTPETRTERIKKLDSLSSGFLYAVSSSSTTGSETSSFGKDGYLEKLRDLSLMNPVLVGFGIRDKDSFEQASAYANGAIIGTAYIKAISGPGDLEASTKTFISSIRS